MNGPLAPLLKNLFVKFEDPERSKRAELVNSWQDIAGGYFSKHTKPQFTKQNKIVVWVDDSTIAFELSQKYKQTILKRLQNQFGEDQIKDVRFIVGEIR